MIGCSFFLFSCKKELKDFPARIIADAGTSKDGVQPYPFSWETADFVPTPPGTSITVPWGSGSNQLFDADLATDYNNSDGWVLVYNMFNTSFLPNPGYFMLYNRYRGLLRIYFYLYPSGSTPSSFITHGLTLGGTNPASPLLNFAGNDITDVSTNLQNASQVQPYQLVTSGGWYVAQFELAFDQNITNVSYSALNLIWKINASNISQVILDGQQNGTLTGTLQQPASNPNLAGVLVQGAFMATGAAVLSNNPNMFPTVIQNAIQGGIQNGLQGVVRNVFSAIFGGNSGSTTEVHLNINTKINLTGTIAENSQVLNNVFYIPATVGNQTAPGYSPGYDLPLGVFNLSNRPTINRHTTTQIINNENGRFYRYNNTYTVDNNSFQIIYNPAVINSSPSGAQIQNTLIEVALLDPEPVIFPETVQFSGTHETIGTHDAYTGTLVSSIYTVTRIQPPATAVVRISFNVVPNGSTTGPLIVHTFLANIVDI